MPRFTVDTHLFRELGELLVGRDSTALVELIKNSYDADATEVTVFGENLGKANARILITDNGNGMTETTFTSGFLRIASRIKEQGDRRSSFYKRRFTGAKGVGRLAAQKLAWNLYLLSVPDPNEFGTDAEAIEATIDWKKIDDCETLDDPAINSAITVGVVETTEGTGTVIELRKLRGKWTAADRTQVIHEVTTFQPPGVLVHIPARVTTGELLFDEPLLRDVDHSNDPGFEIKLEGDFDVGEEYWTAVAEAADWILEIASDHESGIVSFLVSPTKSYLRDHQNAEQHRFDWDAPSVEYVPSFHARILIREGNEGFKEHQRGWLNRSAGIRIYMEGFRVLPYGDLSDDWAELDYDYAKRQRSLRFLADTDIDISKFGTDDQDFGLQARRKSSYFGAVFLTSTGASELEMLVNREGFIPNSSFLSLKQIVRVGIDLSVRVKAFEGGEDRKKWRDQRANGPKVEVESGPKRMKIREAAESATENARNLAHQARVAAAAGDHRQAEKLILSAGKAIERGTELAGELISDRSIMQILAGVGLQMAAFVHEMNALLGMASAVEVAVDSIHKTCLLDEASRKQLAKLSQSVGDLRRVVERQASYLKDVTSPDSRRRRSRQCIRERFEAATKLVRRAADVRAIVIENKIANELKSPPIFPAELTVVFSNLLSNAIKACKRNGRVQAKAKSRNDGVVTVIIQNTGTRVKLQDAEKWFLPFKSTTVEADPVLGQGMGMGLPIVRNILEEYGATVSFVVPNEDFATAIQITFN